MKTVKKLLAFLALCFIAIVFAGCDLLDGSIENLLSPPKPTIAQEGLKLAIESVIGEDVRYIMPGTGNQRSSVKILEHSYNDAQWALVFYCDEENLGHIAVFKSEGENAWEFHKDFHENSMQIDFVESRDFTEDGLPELLVGWYHTENTKEMCAYNIFDGSSSASFNITYNESRIFHGKGKDFIFTVYRERLNGKGTASISANDEGELKTVAECSMFGGYDNVKAITYGKIFNAQSVVLVDASVGSSMVTQVFKWSNKGLENVFYDETDGVSPSLIRETAFTCTDIDGDGIIEMPYSVNLNEPKGMPSGMTKMVVTGWFTMNFPSVGQRTVGVLNRDFLCLMLPQQKYYYVIPYDWIGHITAGYSSIDGSCTLYYTDEEGQQQKLFSLKLITEEEYSLQDDDAWQEVKKDGSKVYVIKTVVGLDDSLKKYTEGLQAHQNRLMLY